MLQGLLVSSTHDTCPNYLITRKAKICVGHKWSSRYFYIQALNKTFAAAAAAEAAAGKGMRQKPLVFERSLKEKGARRF
jgi:hypothetical protein